MKPDFQRVERGVQGGVDADDLVQAQQCHGAAGGWPVGGHRELDTFQDAVMGCR